MKTQVCVSERFISSGCLFSNYIHNTLVHKSWRADSQKLSLACPAQFDHDTRQGRFFSISPPLFSLLFLCQASLHDHPLWWSWDDPGMSRQLCPHTIVSEHLFSLIAAPWELCDVYKSILPTPIPRNCASHQFTWNISNDAQQRGRKNYGLRPRPSMYSHYSFLKCWRWNPGASHMFDEFYRWTTVSAQANPYPEFPLPYDHFYPIEMLFTEKSPGMGNTSP